MFKFYVLVMCFISNVYAQDDFDFGEDLNDSSDNSNQEQNKTVNNTFKVPYSAKLSLNMARQVAVPSRWVSLSPSLLNVVDYHTDYGSVYLEADLKYNHAYAQENDVETIKNKYAQEATVRELYYKKSFTNTTLTIGRSIVVWGAGDFLSVLDLVSPTDNRSAFFTRPQTARLGQDLLALSYWHDDSEISVIYSPRAQMNRYAIQGHHYGLVPDYDISSSKKAEFAARLKSSFTSTNISVIAGKFHQRDPFVVIDKSDFSTKLEYYTYNALGVALSHNIADLLIKFETVKMHDYNYQYFNKNTPELTQVDTTGYLFGLDYNHDTLGSFITEINLKSPTKLDKNKKIKNVSFFAFSWSKNYFKDDLSLSLAAIGFEKITNNILRLGLSYKISDSLVIDSQFSFINIKSSNEVYKKFENYDRIDMGITYSFDLSQ